MEEADGNKETNEEAPTVIGTTETFEREHEQKLSLAKELFSLNDAEKKREAVAILIDISKQGNQEATNILANCLDNREGITVENEGIVEWCVKTSEEEKRLRRAVRELYNLMKKEGTDKVDLKDIDEALKKAEGKLKVSHWQSCLAYRFRNEAIEIILNIEGTLLDTC